MASNYSGKEARERAEDRALMEQGVIITGQRGQDPTHVWRLEPDSDNDPYYSAYPRSSSDEDEYEGEQYSGAEGGIEVKGQLHPSVTLLHANANGPRLRMKSGALVADEFKNLPRHPFVMNPNEDPMRLLTPAEDHETATFGGLVIGYRGDQPQSQTPGSNDYMYRGFLFKPGSNIGPEYPGDLSMTPYCIPKSSRVRQVENDEARRGQMLAHFAPTLTPSFGSRRSDDSKISYGLPLPDPAAAAGADTDPSKKEKDKDLNVFVFFGKPQPIPPIDCPPVFPTSDETVLDYVDEHNLELFFEHLLSLCVLDFREQPFEFMAEYCDNLIQARTSLAKFDELARVFYPSHVAAVYRLFDKQQIGWVTLTKYRLGMEVIGLSRYKPDPDGYEIDQIRKETFCDEGCRALEIMLRSFMA